jgi:hypothetical protein
MHSVVSNGTVKDIRYKRRHTDTVVYLGDEYIGQLFKIRNRYSAVYKQLSDLGFIKVDGFATRYDATHYLLRLHVYKE